MKTFKQFIKESSGSHIIVPWEVKPLNIEDAKHLLNTEYSQAFEELKKGISGNVLFKGVNHSWTEDCALIDPTNSARMSKDYSGTYQLMMSHSANFKGVPDRTKSVICTGDLEEAKAYGKPLVVLPINNTRIAISDMDDFLKTPFKTSYFSGILATFDKVVKNFILDTNNSTSNLYTSFNDIDEDMSKIDPLLLTLLFISASNESIGTAVLRRSLINLPLNLLTWYDEKVNLISSGIKRLNYLSSSPSFKPMFDKILDFVRANGFAIDGANYLWDIFKSNKPLSGLANDLTPNMLGITTSTGRGGMTECWFSDKCIMLSFAMAQQVINENV